MLKEELLAVLRLQATPKVGDIIAKKLIRTIGSASQIFKEKKDALLKLDGIGEYIVHEIHNQTNLKHAEKELNYIDKNAVQYSYFLEKDYPGNLKNCIDAPVLFFYDGNLDWNTDRIISIVGTRKMTNYGRDFCNQLVKDVSSYNPLIVSGFAYGVDICAHKAALENDLQTIGVLAHGFEEIYPKGHKKYMHKILTNGGFITEFWHNEQLVRENFLKRNRIVAGISKAILIIESAKKGGALVTASIANSYNRDVFALPGRNTDIYSGGCNNLIKNNQAHLLSSSEDLIKMLNWDIQEKVKVQPPKLFIELTEEEQKIYDYLLKKGKQHMDSVAFNCEIPIYKLSSLLIQMELKNIIKPLPGKIFEV